MPDSRFRRREWLILLVLSLFILNSGSAFTLSAVDISPANATTTDDLFCTWNITDSAVINVSWYNNSVLYTTINDAANPQKLDNSLTKKNEVWNCTVNAGNSTTTGSLSKIVTIQNSYPSAPNIGNQTLVEDQLFAYTLAANDADGDTVRFPFYESSTITLDSFNANTGYFAWTPGANNVGIHNITFYSKDNDPVLIGKLVSFNVTFVNDIPYFTNSFTAATIAENQTLAYAIALSDEENSTGPFGLTINSSYNPERLEAYTTNNKTFTIRFTNNRKTNFSDTGNYTVTVRACDPANSSLCISNNFTLEVTPINHAPVLGIIPNVSGVQGENFVLYVNATDMDESDTLNFSINKLNCQFSNPWNITTINISSTNATAVINLTLLNQHIACRNITVSVTDSNYIVSQNVYLNLANRDDPPSINNYSYYPGNSHNNINIRNLSAYLDLLFVYKINGTDPDIIYGVDQNEALTYATNSSLCAGSCPYLTLNASSGIVTFMPNSTFLGDYYYLVTLTDAYGNFTTEMMNITVLNNTPPYFNQTPANQTGFEDILFTYKLNATDNEGSSVGFSDDSALFDISQAGLINFTPTCSDVGSYNIIIRINDTFGAENQAAFTLRVNMTPDAPVLPTIYNATILEEMPFYLDIGQQTTDADITCNQTDYVNFTSMFLTGNTLFNISPQGIISFTPNDTSSGNYRINITAFDIYGLRDSKAFNITIYNRSAAPIIHNISPYGYPTVFGWAPLSAFPANQTNINLTENISVTFDHNSTDPDNDPLAFNWTLDGVVAGALKNYTYSWDFESSGAHQVNLTVSDIVLGIAAHEIKFSWNITVQNVNRPPVLNSSLPDIQNMTQALRYLTYLNGTIGSRRFVDPDGDALTYSYSPASYVTISIEGSDAIFTPIAIGADTVVFTASDGYSNVSSNNVTINVTHIPENTSTTTTITTTTNSGGRSDSGTVEVPYAVIQEVEKEKQLYLDIIAPEPVVIYKNNTLREVISIINRGNSTLRGIHLGAETNNTDATISFSNDYIPELLPGQVQKTDLIISSYKLLNNYEVIIWANVTEPEYKDKVIIYVNALEKSYGNQSVTATKITFTQDLLNSNPECLELNEFIKKARDYIDRGNYEAAAGILDSVIQGCKYLVSQSKLKDERPTGFVIGLDFKKVPYLLPSLAIFVLVMAIGIYMTYRTRKMNNEENS